jgi:hypothetical protein
MIGGLALGFNIGEFEFYLTTVGTEDLHKEHKEEMTIE